MGSGKPRVKPQGYQLDPMIALWRSHAVQRVTHAARPVDWERHFAGYKAPAVVKNLDDAPGWSPGTFNPYLLAETCARTVSAAILTFEGDGSIDELAAAFASYDGLVWRVPVDVGARYEVILPFEDAVTSDDFRAHFQLPLPSLSGWRLVGKPTDLAVWHWLPCRLRGRPHQVRRLDGERLRVVEALPDVEPQRPPVELDSPLAEIVAASRMRRCSGDLEPLLRPAIRLVQTRIKKTPATGSCRLGGLPELPADVKWPSYRELPMMFIAQLDLAAVHASIGDSALPATGWLWFFANRQHEFSDDKRTTNVCKVIYRDIAADRLSERAYPTVAGSDDYELLPTHSERVATLAFERFELLPIPPSPFLPRHLDHDDYLGVATTFADAVLSTGEYLLGHICQGDWVDACKRDERLLLRVSSGSQADFSWGDIDPIYFVIPAADLDKARFDRVMVYCGLG